MANFKLLAVQGSTWGRGVGLYTTYIFSCVLVVGGWCSDIICIAFSI